MRNGGTFNVCTQERSTVPCGLGVYAVKGLGKTGGGLGKGWMDNEDEE